MITSLQNPLVKRLRALRDKTDRDRQGCFLIEGEKEIHLAAAAGIEIETLAYCSELLSGNETIVSEEQVEFFFRGHSVELAAVAQHVYEKCAYRQTTGGMIAIAKIPKMSLAGLKLPPSALVLVVHGLEKPGNLGAILRTADGAGVDAVCVCDSRVDLYNPNVVRASVGSLFTVAVLKTHTEELLDWLRGHHFDIFASTPDAKSSYFGVDYGRRSAIVVGSEHEGLPEIWLRPPARTIRIPMQGKMDSLNVSCSAAIVLYEAVRQRKKR